MKARVAFESHIVTKEVVYYDPADPSSAVLMTGVSSEEKYMLGTGSHFFRCDRC